MVGATLKLLQAVLGGFLRGWWVSSSGCVVLVHLDVT